MSSTLMTKACSCCKNVLPISDFRDRVFGHTWRSACKRCEARKAAAARTARTKMLMPVVFELLTQYGPMRARAIIDMLKTQHNIPATAQRLYQSLPLWEHAHRITIDVRGTVFVYRIVGDSRPVFAPPSATPKHKEYPVVDNAEMDAWWARLQAEVAERKAQRARMQW